MKSIKSRKAVAMGTGLQFIASLIMFILILSTGGYVLVKADFSDNLAETAARNLGATIDSAMVTPADVTIINECPENRVFTIETRVITVSIDATVGAGTGDYAFMAPSHLNMPKTDIDCDDWDYIKIVKRISPGTKQTELKIVLMTEEVDGESEESTIYPQNYAVPGEVIWNCDQKPNGAWAYLRTQGTDAEGVADAGLQVNGQGQEQECYLENPQIILRNDANYCNDAGNSQSLVRCRSGTGIPEGEQEDEV